MLGCYRRKLKIGGKSFHLPISLIFHFKYKSECRKKTKSSLEEVRFFSFNRLSTTVYGDATTQLFIYLYFFQMTFFLFVFFSYFVSFFKSFFFTIYLFFPFPKRQINKIITWLQVLCPLIWEVSSRAEPREGYE